MGFYTTTPPGGSNTNLQFNNSGVFGGSSSLTYDGNKVSVLGTSTSDPQLYAKAFSGQSGAVLRVDDPSGNLLAWFRADGANLLSGTLQVSGNCFFNGLVGMGTAFAGEKLAVSTNLATNAGVVVHLAASQSADAITVKNSSGTSVMHVAPSGNILTNGLITATQTVTGSNFTTGNSNFTASNAGNVFAAGNIQANGGLSSNGNLAVNGSLSTDSNSISSDGGGDLTVGGGVNVGGSVVVAQGLSTDAGAMFTDGGGALTAVSFAGDGANVTNLTPSNISPQSNPDGYVLTLSSGLATWQPNSGGSSGSLGEFQMADGSGGFLGSGMFLNNGASEISFPAGYHLTADMGAIYTDGTGGMTVGTITTTGNATFYGSSLSMPNLPTSDPGVPGALWNSGGQVMVS